MTAVACIAAFAVGIVYASLAEWTIHKFLMHRPLFNFKHFFKGHAQIHHGVYKGDETYLVGDREPRELTLAWWAMPFPIVFHLPILILLGSWFGVAVPIGLIIAFAMYQFSYEYFHYCMHVPRDRWFERTPMFQWVNEHHLQHHRKHGTNLNVVLPLADFLFGTSRKLSALPVSLRQVVTVADI